MKIYTKYGEYAQTAEHQQNQLLILKTKKLC